MRKQSAVEYTNTIFWFVLMYVTSDSYVTDTRMRFAGMMSDVVTVAKHRHHDFHPHHDDTLQTSKCDVGGRR